MLFNPQLTIESIYNVGDVLYNFTPMGIRIIKILSITIGICYKDDQYTVVKSGIDRSINYTVLNDNNSVSVLPESFLEDHYFLDKSTFSQYFSIMTKWKLQ